MLIGNVMEKTDAQSAWQLCADKLADWVRTKWQEHEKAGEQRWEETASVDEAALPGLREEGFRDLVGIDYILKWWGGKDTEELSGELDVIWKTAGGEGQESVTCYRSWVKLAPRDFILGLYKDERDKREANREGFREAFAQWKQLFAKL